jgi:prophage maintenance system killer protein
MGEMFGNEPHLARLEEPLLTAQELLVAQAEIATELGDPVGTREGADLEDALRAPLRAVAGRAVYEVPFRRASVLARTLLLRRCFLSCNRRVATVAVRAWMEREGYYMTCRDEDLIATVDAFADLRLPEQRFSAWLSRNFRRLTGPHPGGDPGVRRIGSRANFAPLKASFPQKYLLGRPDPKNKKRKGFGLGFFE